MKSTARNLLKEFLANPLFAPLLALALWIAGAYTGSAALMIVSGILAFGRPLFYVTLLHLEENKRDREIAKRPSLTPACAGAAAFR